jgi:hypothetical protein
MPQPLLSAPLLVGKSVAYLLLARFGIDTPAPLVNPLPVDVGALTVTDTESKLSQQGGVLRFGPKATPSTGDPGVWGSVALARKTGRAVFGRVVPSSGAGNRLQIGWDTDQANTVREGIDFQSTSVSLVESGAGVATTYPTTNDGVTTTECAVIQRSAGCWFLVRGGPYSDWNLLWVANADTSSPLYPAVPGRLGTPTLDDFRVVDLGSPWNQDYGPAPVRLLNPVAGAIPTYNHPADCLLEFNFTYGSGLTYGVAFRTHTPGQTSNNWRCYASAGGTLVLDQVVATVATARISVGSTFVAGTVYRIVVMMVGNVYTVFVNDVSKGTYTDATNFQTTETLGYVAFAGSPITEMVIWPRYVSGLGG